MFTFSFSTAFAANGDNYSASIGDPSFESMWAEAVKVTADSDTIHLFTENKTCGMTVDKAVLAGLKAEAKAVYDYYMVYVVDGYLTTSAALLNDVLNFDGDNVDDTLALKQEAFKLALVKAQFAADKAEALALVGTVPTYNYSTEVMSDAAAGVAETQTGNTVEFVDKDYTYQEAATMLVEFYKEAIEDVDNFNADSTIINYVTAYETTLPNAYASAFYPMAYVTKNTAGAITAVALTGAYDFAFPYTLPGRTYAAGVSAPAAATGGLYVIVGSDVNAWSVEKVAADDKIDAAAVAAVKAQNAANYANYIVGQDAEGVKYANNWLKVVDILAELGYSYTVGDPQGTIVAPNGLAYSAKFEPIANLEYNAARLAAEKNADGELIRDAALVQEYLEEGIENIATATTENAIASAYTTALAKIRGAVSATIADELAFEKDSAKKAVESLLARYEANETYYAVELAKIKGYADTYLAKIEAAEENTDVQKAYHAFLGKVAAVKTAATLNTEWTTAMDDVTPVDNTPGADALYDAAMAYVTYFNGATEGTTADLNSTKLEARLAKMIGESGLRTATEMKTLKEQAVAVAQGLPTNAEVTAAKKAVVDAVKALPAKTTAADLALVQAASDAIKAYAKLDTTALTAETANYNTAVDQLVAAYNAQFAPEYAKVVKTDKAALKALNTEIGSVVTAIKKLSGYVASDTTYLEGLKTLISNNLTTIKNKEAEAVEDLIAAIPINVTEADKAVVEAARAAYDAYVAEYNDYSALYNATTDLVDATADYTAGYAANDIVISVLTAAETVLGLNDKSEEIAKMEAIAAIEGLKIKASSTKGKGWIKVKWTVSEEVEDVKYQVYKSTKAHSGYKKSITTSKTTFKNTKNLKAGTRYFYKVRAIGEVDGVTYYSDWSNKANRVAK